MCIVVVGAHMLPSQTLDAGHEIQGLVYAVLHFILALAQACFSPVLLEWECLFYHYVLEECNFLIFFIGITTESMFLVPGVSEKILDF